MTVELECDVFVHRFVYLQSKSKSKKRSERKCDGRVEAGCRLTKSSISTRLQSLAIAAVLPQAV